MSHTPGPWEMVCVGGRGPTDHYGVLDSAGDKVALLSHREECPQAEANARLIAAAPELLEALRGMLDFFAPDDGQGTSIDAVMRAEYVLAKIDGAQP